MNARPIVTNPAILENLKEQLNNVNPIHYPISELINKVYCMDSVNYLSQYETNSVDMVFTDEPYGQGFANIFFYNQGNGKRAKNPITRSFDWDNKLPLHLIIPWVYEVERILKDGGVLLNCGLASWSTSFEDVCHDAGLTFRAHIPWIKTNPMRQIHPGSWRSAHESIWIASKGTLAERMRGKVVQNLRVNWHIEAECPECHTRHNVIDQSNYTLLYRGFSELGGLLKQNKVPDKGEFEAWVESNIEHLIDLYLLSQGNLPVHVEPKRDGHSKTHDTQKPSWMSQFYTDLLTKEGDIVVDPFCGSGELLLASAKAGRVWGANDISHENKVIAETRLTSTERSMFNYDNEYLPEVQSRDRAPEQRQEMSFLQGDPGED